MSELGSWLSSDAMEGEQNPENEQAADVVFDDGGDGVGNENEPEAPNQFLALQQAFGAILDRLPPPGQQQPIQVVLPTQPSALRFAVFNLAKTDPNTWLIGARAVVEDRGALSRSELITALTASFEGDDASAWLSNVITPDLTFDRFVELFQAQFCHIDTPVTKIYRALTLREPDTAKLVTEQLIKIRSAVRGKTADECALLFVGAIAARNEPEIRRWVLKHEHLDERKIVKELKALKTLPRQKDNQQRQNQNPKPGPSGFQQQQKRHQNNSGQQGPQPFKKRRFDGPQDPSQQQQTQSQQQQQPQQQQKKGFFCSRCQKTNHGWSRCYFNPANQQQRPQQGQSGQGTARQPQKQGQQPEERRVQQCSVNPAGSLQHNGRRYNFQFDSGSEASLLTQNISTEFSGQKYIDPVTLVGITNDKIICKEKLSAMVLIDNIEIPVNFIIVPDNLIKTPILLGRDVLLSGVNITVFPDRYEFCVTTKESERDSKLRFIQCKNNKSFPKHKKVVEHFPRENSDDNLVSSISQPDEFSGNEIACIGNVQPKIHNESENYIPPVQCLEPKIDLQVESISASEGPYDGRPILQGSTAGESESFNPLTEPLDTDLTDQNDINTLRSILSRYSDNFTRGLPRQTIKTAEFSVRLQDPTKIVNRRPYRLHPRDREAVREYIQELLDAKIIQHSHSPWSFPCLLVSKKNGRLRMVTDFRALNQNTISDRYPIPLIPDCISRLSGQNYFSSLDCASGFYGIATSEATREILAFSTPDGHYEYCRMPFGVKNAPTVFQRAVIHALGPLADQYVIAYMDDLLIVSTTIQEGLSRLAEVLKCLAAAGFSLNPSKCSFLKSRIIYLGYEIQNGEIRPHNDRIRALIELPPPKDRTALRSFLSFCSYYRTYVPKFSQLCSKLYQLTSTKTEFKWTPEHEDIRKNLIEILTGDRVLTIFNPNAKIEMWVDSSSIGFGGILYNIIDGQRKVVGYFSRRTTPTEAKYHSYELETLGCVKAIRNWQHFLLYSPFTVVSDCRSFQATYQKQNLIPRIQRHWAYLQIFQFTIVFKPGSQLGTVDFLSRYPLQEPMEIDIFEASVEDSSPTNALEDDQTAIIQKQFPDALHNEHVQKSIHLLELTGEWLHIAQLQDEEIQNTIKQLENNQMNPDIANTYILKDIGDNLYVLCRKIQFKKKTHVIPIVPNAYKWVVTNAIHESIMHLGPTKTVDAILAKFWFPGLNKFVKKFIQNCVTCQLGKSTSGKKQMEYHMIPKEKSPFHTVHIDATGTLTGQSDKNYYIVMVCAFTKFIFIHHTKNVSAKAAINALSELISLFGAPTRLIYDQGGSFTAISFTQFCQKHHINLHPVATGSSRANGQVERYMKSITNLVTTAQYLNKKQSVKQLAGKIQLILNATTNRVTKYSPIELLTGKRAEIPSTLYLSEELNPSSERSDLEEIRTQAHQDIIHSQNYDLQRLAGRRAPVVPLQLDDLCIRELEPRSREKTGLKFRGIYRVVELLPNDRYTIQDINSGRKLKYAHDRLRKIHNDPSILPFLINNDTDTENSDQE